MRKSDDEKQGWTLVAVFLLIGLLCVIVAGNLAIRFVPSWTLQADMRSRLDPDSVYFTSQPGYAFQLVDPAILTPPIWINVFLTPGQIIPTRVPKATVTQISTPIRPSQAPPTISPTVSPTPALVYFTATQTSIPGSTRTLSPLTSTAIPTLRPYTATVIPTLISGTATVIPSKTPLPQADLRVTMSDGVTVYSAGGTLTYNVVVSNGGSYGITGAVVTDTIPAQVASWNWVCASQTGGASGCLNMNGGMNFSNTLTLPANSSITYTVSAGISWNAAGNLTNLASVSLPAPAMDPVPANNTAIDVDSPGVDLQITKSDGMTTYTAGGTSTYTVVVTNNSTFNVNGAVVTDLLPAMISSASWTCTAAAGAGCTPGGTGSINDTVSLPPGLAITYQLTATVSPYAAGTLKNTASVTAPAGFVETAPGNNGAEDANASVSAEPDIGPPNGSWLFIPPDTSVTIVSSPAILADGDGGVPDFVFYERLAAPDNPTNVELDWVQVEISSDGSTWYQVFYWGDPGGSPDVNTNVDVQNLIADLCSTEVDNCVIPPARLYNSTGITMDIDGIVPPGYYPWIRITSPASPDGSEVDAIQPYYP
jgi:uncharacterized repeat protein (TIGR01451 family)